MARLADSIVSHGIKPCSASDFISREDTTALGAQFRELRNQIAQALDHGNLEAIIENDPTIAKIIETSRSSNPRYRLSTKDAAKKWIDFIDEVKSDYELGRIFNKSLTLQGISDESLVQKIFDAVVINATNVCQYLDALKDAGHNFLVSEIGVQAPLFEKYFIEFDLKNTMPFSKAGILVEKSSSTEALNDKNNKGEIKDADRSIFQDAKWVLKLTLVAQENKNQPVKGPIFTCYLPLDENGLMIPNQENPNTKIVLLGTQNIIDDENISANMDLALKITGFASEANLVAFMASSFANCTNINLIEQDPNVQHRKANKTKNKKNLVKYKTLNIEKLEEATRVIRESIAKGTEIPLQIVRGHFKRYTQDRPLFGNRVGQWWWMGQVRGTAKAGAVLKDYSVSVNPADKQIGR